MLVEIHSQLAILAAALLLDRLIGDPDWLWRRINHPVVVFGALIGFADRRFNRDGDPSARRLRNGRLVLLALLSGAVILGIALKSALLALGAGGTFVEIIIVAVFLAQKSLGDHVLAVSRGLADGGLSGGRRAVSMIVGRDPETLDEAGVSRAAIESLAENFSDGIVAPALFYAVFGLPGLLAYKMLNTADSMIGHKSLRHLQFGRAAAIADDWANWPAARLSAALIALSALPRSRQALSVALRDHGLHRSPNAGWPEAAMAGALDVALAGPRVYGGDEVTEPMLHAAGRSAQPADIARALVLFWRACTVMLVVVAGLAIACA